MTFMTTLTINIDNPETTGPGLTLFCFVSILQSTLNLLASLSVGIGLCIIRTTSYELFIVVVVVEWRLSYRVYGDNGTQFQTLSPKGIHSVALGSFLISTQLASDCKK